MIARCRHGEAGAWDELFDLHYPAAARFVTQLSDSLTLEDVEEVCQEVFLTVIRNLATFQGRSRFQTWVFRIAVNRTRDFIERQRAQKRGGGQTPVSLEAENPETGLRPDPPSTAPGPDDVMVRREQSTLVQTALDEIGEPCRETLELRYFGDLSYEEIAAALEMNPKTVSSRLSKCLDRMQEIVQRLIQRENSTPFSV